MKSIKGFMMILLAAFLFVSFPSHGKDQAPGSGEPSGEETSATAKEGNKAEPGAAPETRIAADTLLYKPPLRGSPGGRVGGGTRGASLESPVSVSVLAPDHVAATLQSQPHLYWFISGKTTHPIEVTITEKEALKPVLEIRLDPLEREGFQCIRLADHGVRLRPNVPYKWFVAVVTEPDRRSKDILSGGMIEVVSPSPSLSARLRQAEKAEQPSVLAEDGIWYDALAGLSDRIDASPKDLSLRKQRAALLNQVGLNEAAEFDLKEARSTQ